MAVPTNYIFTSGMCAKNEIYDLIINSLIAAGWTDISSKASTDYVVLSSTGNTGDKALLLNLRDVNVAGSNSVKTTNYNTMSYRLQDTYVPGASGVAGTFGRASLAWSLLDIVPTTSTSGTLAMDTVINYHVYADASKIILALEYPTATGYSPLVFYLGEPDTMYTPETGNKGCLFATTANVPTANGVIICNSPDSVGTVTSPYALTSYGMIAPSEPNVSGKRFPSPILYGSATEGYRGKLDGLLVTVGSNILTGDTVTIGSQTYYALVCQTQGYVSFPTRALLVRTA